MNLTPKEIKRLNRILNREDIRHIFLIGNILRSDIVIKDGTLFIPVDGVVVKHQCNVTSEDYNLLKRASVSFDLADYWRKMAYKRKLESNAYKVKPIIPRKDNSTDVNYGSGYNNRNKIRLPKKCRKTAWKRFHKLFPNFNENKFGN